MIIFAAVAMGLLLGLSLGALGGGGSILTVPALVYVLGQTPRAATGESLVLVGLTALAAALAHARAGHVRTRPGLLFGLAGLAASYAGTAVNSRIDPQALLLAFAALMLASATAMITRGPAAKAADDRADAPTPGEPPAPPDGAAAATHGAVLILDPPIARRTTRRPTAASVVKILAAGSLVGFLTGLLGVGGGFVIVPVLVMALGYPIADAVGTSLLVIAANSAAALLARTGHLQLHWMLLGPFLAAAVAGSLAGHRVADRLPAATLKRAFATLLVLVAGYVTVRAGAAPA